MRKSIAEISLRQHSYGQYSVNEEIREVNSERTDDDENSAGGGSSSGLGQSRVSASPVYSHEQSYDGDKPVLVDEGTGISSSHTPNRKVETVESIIIVNRALSQVEVVENGPVTSQSPLIKGAG